MRFSPGQWLSWSRDSIHLAHNFACHAVWAYVYMRHLPASATHYCMQTTSQLLLAHIEWKGSSSLALAAHFNSWAWLALVMQRRRWAQ